MKRKIDALAGLALALGAGLALAGPSDPAATAMLMKLKALYPATRFTAIAPTPIEGIYEIVMGQNVAYVGIDGRHFLFGHLFDMRTQTDLTAPKLAAAGESIPSPRQVSFSSLPLDDAVKIIRGDGSRRLAVFSDPQCPYCKAQDEELAKLDNVTVYRYLVPWLSPESRPAVQAAWARAVPDRAQDAGVLDRNLKLAREIGLRGTPMLIAADGRVSEGLQSAAELEAWLAPNEARVGLRTPADREQR
jgi:thiol:disulfide interchange protein DsbC